MKEGLTMMTPEDFEVVKGGRENQQAGGARPLIRIAIADDQPIVREALIARLSLEDDFEVVAEARDGHQVPQVLETVDPDILLLDLSMPELDGLATLRLLQGRRLKTRIILLTASEDRSKHIQAVKLGACGVVLKHATTDLLIKSIRKVHEGEIWLERKTLAVLVKQLLSPAATSAAARQPAGLTGREREILELVGQGLRNRQISEQLTISEQTVKNHLHSIFRKLGFGDRLELTLYALQTKAPDTVERERALAGR